MPTIWERSTGFGFSRLDPRLSRSSSSTRSHFSQGAQHRHLDCVSAPLRATFGRLGDDIENSSGWCVTLDDRERRIGVRRHRVIAWFVATRWPRWKTRQFEPADRIVLVFAAVLVANAAMCCVYTKDEIMEHRRRFLCAGRLRRHSRVLSRFKVLGYRPLATVAVVAPCLPREARHGAIRATGLYYAMYRESSSKVRYEWAEVEVFLRAQQIAPARRPRFVSSNSFEPTR